MTVPALSIRQPWAELILRGVKRVELRSWHTHYRGPLWIHTGRRVDSAAAALHGISDPYAGGYVGGATLAAVVELDVGRWSQWADLHLGGGYEPGQHGWVLTDVGRLADPVPAPGRLGLFYPEAEVAEELERRRRG